MNWLKLHQKLNKLREDMEVSWRKFAQEIGVTPSVFTRIGQEKPVSVANLIAVLSVFNYPHLVFNECHHTKSDKLGKG